MLSSNMNCGRIQSQVQVSSLNSSFLTVQVKTFLYPISRKKKLHHMCSSVNLITRRSPSLASRPYASFPEKECFLLSLPNPNDFYMCFYFSGGFCEGFLMRSVVPIMFAPCVALPVIFLSRISFPTRYIKTYMNFCSGDLSVRGCV